MTNKTELLPCPFCGGKAEIDTLQGYRNIVTGALETAVSVYCASCDANCTSCRGDHPDLDPQVVIDRWNTRDAPPEDVRAVVDEPVAWMDPRSPEMSATISNEVKQHNLKFGGAPSAAVNGYCIPLYRHPQRPMVLPERKEILQVWEPCDEVEQFRNEGFNACLDRIAELNK